MVPRFFICVDYMKFKNHNRYKADDATMNTTRKPKRKGKHNAYYQNPYTQ